jgi:hypothetical protein
MIINNKKIVGTEQSVNPGDLGLFAGSDDKFYVKKSDGTSYPLWFTSSGSFSTFIDSNQIAFGSTQSGLTSSSLFSIEPSEVNLIFGVNSIITAGSTGSIILGGLNHLISTQSLASSIVGGYCNTLSDESNVSSIIGGLCNTLCFSSVKSSIIGGECNTLSCYSYNSSIIGGVCNTLSCGPDNSSIIGGQCNTLSCYSAGSSIIGGYCNLITGTSSNSVILGGSGLTLTNTCDTSLTQHLWIAGSVSPNNGSNFGLTNDYFITGFGTFSFYNGVLINVIV